MYKPRYLQYINLPCIPSEIVDGLTKNFDDYQAKSEYENYVWTDTHNEHINSWCQANICQHMYWGFQIMRGDISPHRDIGTHTKFVYLLQPGGANVVTRFWHDDEITLLDEYVIEPNRWHILKVDSLHSVTGVIPGMVRFSITGKIF